MKLLLLNFLFLSNVHALTTFNWGIDEVLHHQVKIAKEFKKNIFDKSGGEINVNIKLFGKHHGDLKETANAIVRIKKGQFDIAQSIAGNFIDEAPELKVWEVPFLFESEKHIEEYLKSDRAKNILSKLETKSSIAINYSFAGGFLYMYGPKKLNQLSDYKNVSCDIVPDFGFFEDFLSHSGIKKAALNLIEKDLPGCGEVLSSEVDSLYSSGNVSNLWVNRTNHRVVSRITMVSKVKLNKLSEENKSMFIKLLKDSLQRERHLVYEASSISYALIKNRGANIHDWSINEFKHERKKLNKFMVKYQNIKSEINYIRGLNQANRNLSSSK